MSLKECYVKLGGDYEEVLARLFSEDMVRRFLKKFLSDGTYRLLLEKLSSEDYPEAFRAGERPENLDVLIAQVCTDYEQAASAIQMLTGC
ncbi:Hpt domain-containing protein [Cuneatibacter sp. NSJ-177]|uniref:Hpt domain-containing protein n=1 Tax=Cuneatibacter sp. NSJ-177 TaxID=2931401 RepID=UPI001FD2ECC7|nr:Hpt domain-containing protein [Cuneatibacter sp. NSJ-177]MCJ7834538.1 Hpt domain-containing protein [Cuneatibacter sp. NSJ-177]